MGKLTQEQRRAASRDLTLTYLQNYYVEWRYTKVLTIQKLINHRYTFYDELTDLIKSAGDSIGDATIAQEVHNGLYFDAIAQVIQYIEDLFALLRASKQPDFFIKNIITYKAGEVTSWIRSIKPAITVLAPIFHFPDDLKLGIESDQEKFDVCCKNIETHIEEIIVFFKNYEFFYNQYKHGLAVAMRPFGSVYSKEMVAKDKTGEIAPFLAVYDNMNLSAGFKKGTARTTQGIMMPGLTDNVAPYLSKLAEENNYLRFVPPPDFPTFNMDLLVKKAALICNCIRLFMFNYANQLQSDGKTFQFRLPNEDFSKATQFTFQKGD